MSTNPKLFFQNELQLIKKENYRDLEDKLKELQK
jgi:hypothetical protein